MANDDLFPGRPPRLWMRVEQNDDKAFLAQVPEASDGFIVNANLIESAAASAAAFLDRLGRPFAIDPISYRLDRPAWILRDSDDVPKRNYIRLWKKLVNGVTCWTGDPLSDDVASLLDREGDLLRYCSNNLLYQEAQLREVWVDEVSGFVGTAPMFEGFFTPQISMAPYVVIDASHEARQLAVQLAAATASLARPRHVAAIMAIEAPQLADVDGMRALAVRMAQTGIRAVWLWPVGSTPLSLADEPARFTGLVTAIRTLADAGVEVGMLYGGYLAAMLRFFGLRVVSHALMYGESRGLDPTHGRPAAIFYWPPLHRALQYDIAKQLTARMSRSEYLERVCHCPLCQALSGANGGNLGAYFTATRPEGATRDMPTREAIELNRIHFLFARAREFEVLRANPLPVVIQEILDNVDAYPDVPSRPLQVWIERLRSA